MRPFRVVTLEQRVPEWYAARVGMLTGTCAADMLATVKSGEAAARRDLRTRLVVERLTGQSQDEGGFVSKDMQRGTDLEGDAIAAYELASGHMVQPVGFVAHLELPAGCSPDGQVSDYAGIIEAKCPKSATHLGYLRSGKVPTAYMHQITHNLFITGAEWCDFISFDPRFPDPVQLFVRRVNRADVDLKAYELAVRLFLSECDRELAEVSKLIEAAA